MALTLSPDTQAVFYASVFGADHPVTKTVKALIKQGMVFETTLMHCQAKYQGQFYQHLLTVGTNAILKGTVPPIQLAQNKVAIEKWVSGLASSILIPAVPEPKGVMSTATPTYSVMVSALKSGKYMAALKAVRTITGWQLAEAKKFVDAVEGGKAMPLPPTVSQSDAKDWAELLKPFATVEVVTVQVMAPGAETTDPKPTPVVIQAPAVTIKPKPVPHPIFLREALVVGQKVKGTSAGSVYNTVALNDRLKIAVRIKKSGAVSIRAEWSQPISADEKSKLIESGMSFHDNYASMHLDAGAVPASRVVGAFIIGLGIPWTQTVMGGAELVVEGGA